MVRFVLGSVLCLFLASALVQAVRYKPCGGTSDKSCVPRHFCQFRDERVPRYADNRGHSECKSTHVCCLNANIPKKKKAVPAQCGHRNPGSLTNYTSSRVYAQEGEFPWVVALLGLDNNYKGTGSLIAGNLVLTSAYKIIGENEYSLKVRAGKWDRTTDTEHYASVEARVQWIIPHPDFDERSLVNNIGLLVIESSFVPSPHISPISLPSPDQRLDFSRCISNGWVQEKFKDTNNVNFMKMVDVSVVPERICKQKLASVLKEPFIWHESLLCTGGAKGKDSCLVDGGGPLACPLADDPSRRELAGIVNWGTECGCVNMPAMYTNVANMLPWINEIMNANGKTEATVNAETSTARTLKTSTETSTGIIFLPVRQRNTSSTEATSDPLEHPQITGRR